MNIFENKNSIYHGELEIKEYWNCNMGEGTQDGKPYIQYRIPGMVVTNKGTVIIYGESRTNFNLDGHGNNPDLMQFDLYIRRSTDGGETFGAPIYLARGDEYFKAGYGATINNVVIMCGKDDRLHLIYSCNVGRRIRDDLVGGVFYIYSDDDGVTWSSPREITDELGRGTHWSELACGPGHGICTGDGRLMTAAWIDYSNFADPYSVHTVYSDDNGATWKLGEKVSKNKDESCIVELSDGSLMVNSRQYTWTDKKAPFRHVSVSKTGVDGWSETTPDTALIDPACMGSMCSVDIPGLPHAILFINCNILFSRRNVTVKCSFDDGKTWSGELVIDKQNGGYSDIAVDKNGKVYVIYEIMAGKSLNLATFSFYDQFAKYAYAPAVLHKDGVSVPTRTYSPDEVTEDAVKAAISGEGTFASPYVIDSANGLAAVAAATNSAELKDKYSAAHYILTTDIDLGGLPWAGIGDASGAGFTGVFDGGGHTVGGLTLENGVTVNGFFRSAGDGAAIKNLTLSGDSKIEAYRIGGLIGIAKGDLKVENCHVNANITMKSCTEACCLGGIIGRDMGFGDKIIKDCTFNGSLDLDMNDKKSSIGGIVGLINANDALCSCYLIKCKSNGRILAVSDRLARVFEFNDHGIGSLTGTTGWSRPGTVKIISCHAGGTLTAEIKNREPLAAGIAVGYVTVPMKECSITYNARLTVNGEERSELAVFAQNFAIAEKVSKQVRLLKKHTGGIGV